jgi:cytochrome bd-type quinol oxidase subunit 2
MNLGSLSKDFDKLAATIIAAFCVLVITYGITAVISGSSANNTYYFIFGALTLVSCLIWLRVRNVGALQDLDTPPSYELFLLGNVLFFLFLGCAILSFQLRADVYVRPLAYFIFAALIASALALEILTSDTEGKSVWLILTQIIILGCTLQFSELLLFPSVVGNDPWYDQQFALQLISSGHIQQSICQSSILLRSRFQEPKKN